VTVASKGRVLVVDDNDSVRAMLRAGLEAQGWEVLLSDSGDGVAALVEAQGVDAVLLDIVMAGREGIETLLELKAVHSQLPVVMMSSFANYLPMAKTLGADAALEKPLDLGEVAAVLDKLLSDGTGP
jgi:DNA-binding response OmpR family regulator